MAIQEGNLGCHIDVQLITANVVVIGRQLETVRSVSGFMTGDMDIDQIKT